MSRTIPAITAVALSGMPEFVDHALGPRGVRRAFDDAGLPVDTQRQEGLFIPEVAIIKFLGSAARQTGDEVLGALLGTHLDIASYGTWGQYVLEGRTLGECLFRFASAADCFFSYSGFKIEMDGDLAWVRHRYATRGHQHYAQVALASAGSVTNIIRHYLGPEFTPSMVHFDTPPPTSVNRVETFLPFETQYNAPEFGLALPRDLLATPRRSPDVGCSVTISEVRRKATARKPQTLAEAVTEITRLQVLAGRPSLDAAARALDMGPRRLQRELDQVGLGFRDLARGIRMEAARELVCETDMSLSAVSEALGYSDQFNFSRAFHRHFGRRPSACRP